MKFSTLFQGGPKTAGALLLMSSMSLLAADPAGTVSSAPASASAPVTVAPRQLPYGVEDVLRLSRAQVSEDVIINFVRSSGTVYNLSSADVVYLRQEGVSDQVITAMLEKRKQALDASQNQPLTASAAPAAPTTPSQDAAVTAPPNPAPVYVQPPAQPAASSVYVVPYPAATAAYYGYYQPYYGYYGPYYAPYYGPRISIGLGFGGGWGGHWGGGHWGGHWGGGHWGGGHWHH